jgi:hypothetical protein
MKLDGSGNATFAGEVNLTGTSDILLGTASTSGKIRFGTESWGNNIGLEGYWTVHSTNSNEGFKFQDDDGTSLLTIQGGTNTAGNGAKSATFAGQLDVAGECLFGDGATAFSNTINSYSHARFGGVGVISSRDTNDAVVNYGCNFYTHTDGTNKYLTTTHANKITFQDGHFYYYEAASGTANNTITWTNPFKIIGSDATFAGNATFSAGNVILGSGKYLIGANNNDDARINLIGENGSDDIAIGEYNGNKLDNIRFHTKSSQNTLILDDSGDATFAGGITGNGLLTLNNASSAIKMVDSDVSGLHHSFASGSDAGLEIDADLGDVANNSFIRLRVDDSTGITLNDRGSTSLTPGNDQTGLTVTRLNSSGNLVEFKYSTTSVGLITTNTSGVSYTTASDYRLKENITDMTGGVDRIKQLKPKRFSFKRDSESTIVDGLLAHEVMEVVPQAITGLKDEIDENDDPKYQSIDHSKLVPLLVQAVKELSARIEELESK